MAKRGIVYLVGAGPGDPGLITVRAVELLQRADVVVYDNLVNPGLLRHAAPAAKRVFVGKSARRHTLKQEEINQLLVERGRADQVVVRLKGGDPYVFGRGGEEAEELRRAGIPFEVVPGISSSIAAPAYAGIPVTHRGLASAFMVITGHEDPTKPESSLDWRTIAQFQGTRVILMGVERIGLIAAELMRHGCGPDTPVALVRWGTTAQQRTLVGTLGTIASLVDREQFRPPAVTVIGEVVRLRDRLSWFEQRPLLGQRIAVTRSRDQASDLVRQLAEQGADVLEIPTIKILQPRNLAPLREAIASIGIYDWLVFTSPNGVTAFFREFFRKHPDLRELGPVKIASIGSATARQLADYHLEVDLQPAKFTTEDLLSEFRRQRISCANINFLLPRSDLADERLARGLEALGAIVDDLEAYRTAPATGKATGQQARLVEEGADLVTFTSSSTVVNFSKLVDLAALQRKFPRLRFVSIGPQTTKAAADLGLPIATEAEEHTIPGLVQAVLKLVAANR